MSARSTYVILGVLAFSPLAGAQPQSPWQRQTPENTVLSTLPERSLREPAHFPRGAWPVAQNTRARRPTTLTSWEPLSSVALASGARDPSSGHFFQLPTARLLRIGDIMGHYVSHLGWAGARFGLTRSIDVGVGVPYYFVGVSLDARLAITQQPNLAVAWWAYASVPFQPDGEEATTNLGFTWAHAGMGWITGPIVSVWGERAGLHVGAELAQRSNLGGLWLLLHTTLEYRATEGIKAISQLMCLAEISPESGERARTLLGNTHPRVLPYALLGARFYTRKFSADFGALVPLVEGAPLYSSRLPALPWVSLSHLF